VGGGLAYVPIALAFGLSGGLVARAKGNSFLLWFLISAIVPFLGLLAALLYRSERNVPRRRCPRCRRLVKVHDALCTRCGCELEYPETQLMSESEELAARRAARSEGAPAHR
jgi:hypothetical protein